MTQDELQTHIHSIEDRIQRKEQELSKDDAAIIKCDSNIMATEQNMARTKSDALRKTYQRRIESNKKDKLRHQEQKNRHQQELNRLKRDLLSAQRQLDKLPTEKNDAPITAQPTAHMEKIYQIFVSSTFEDLKMERQEVMAAVVSTGNVPIGMEYFPAGNASPFDYIKQQIDGADYYVLIVAGKYGSINDETGISYTEMEFDYAVSKGVPVAVLLYKDLNQLRGSQLETTDERRNKLEAFRKKVQQGRMAASWENEIDLKLKVKEAIDNLIKNSPRTGWIRADQAVVVQQNSLDADLLEKEIEIDVDVSDGTFYLSDEVTPPPYRTNIKNLLDIIVPAISTPKSESAIDEAFNIYYPSIKEESLSVIKACLLKYKLIETNTLIIPNDGIYTAWSVTPLGRSLWAQNFGE